MVASPASFRRQRDADDLLVVAGVDGFVREGGMRPDDGPAGIAVDRIDQVRAAEFLVFLGRELRDDEVALLAEDEAAVAVFDHEGVAPALGLAAGRHEGFPEALARLQLQAAELAIAARAVEVAGR